MNLAGPSSDDPATQSHPWRWIPSLYFAEGVPYVVVMTVAVIMFKRLGIANTQIALYTSWLYLPYAIKPLWSPIVQRFGTRRGWAVVMQLLVGVGLAATALAIPLDNFLRWSLITLACVAIISATHDVAADGFYMLALSSHEQAWFVGIRNTFYRLAMIAGQGLLVMLAGFLESSSGLPTVSVQVNAADRDATAVEFAPTADGATEAAAEQQVKVSANEFDASLRGRPTSDAKSLIAVVRDWNVAHGFYKLAEVAANSSEKAGWVVTLENYLRSWFGPTRKNSATSSDRAGDVVIVPLHLTKPIGPGERQVVQFGRKSGDPSIDVVEGERFEVTEQNWNQPFAAVVQIDPRLREPSQATFEVRSGNLSLAWSTTFFFVAGMFLLLCLYHWLVLPRPAADRPGDAAAAGASLAGFIVPFVAFFHRPRILAILAFLLLYRFAEAQLVKLATPFLLDRREIGGLALSTGEVGFVYGTIGVVMLTLGGILGGFVAARDGLKRWLWPMLLAIHLPNAAFLFLSYIQPESRWLITLAVAVEQFGYGFGFTAYMLYCIYVSRGEYQTVHYAMCTGCMALGMMIPGMWSGWLEDIIGYQHFFAWVMLATLPSFIAAALIPLDAEFGRKLPNTGSK